jgi:hypothetical protein
MDTQKKEEHDAAATPSRYLSLLGAGSICVMLIIAVLIFFEVSEQGYAIKAFDAKHRREVAELSSRLELLEKRLWVMKEALSSK